MSKKAQNRNFSLNLSSSSESSSYGEEDDIEVEEDNFEDLKNEQRTSSTITSNDNGAIITTTEATISGPVNGCVNGFDDHNNFNTNNNSEYHHQKDNEDGYHFVNDDDGFNDEIDWEDGNVSSSDIELHSGENSKIHASSSSTPSLSAFSNNNFSAIADSGTGVDSSFEGNRNTFRQQSPAFSNAHLRQSFHNLKALVIDMGSEREDGDGTKRNNKNKVKRNFKRKKIRMTLEQRQFVMNLFQTHVLCLISKCVYLSKFDMTSRNYQKNDLLKYMDSVFPAPLTSVPINCDSNNMSNDDDDGKQDLLLNVAYSTIPYYILASIEEKSNKNDGKTHITIKNTKHAGSVQKKNSIPSMGNVHKLYRWFSSHVNDVNKRRQLIQEQNIASGAPFATSTRRSISNARRSSRTKKNRSITQIKSRKRVRQNFSPSQFDAKELTILQDSDNYYHLQQHQPLLESPVSPYQLIQLFSYLSISNDNDPQFYSSIKTPTNITSLEKTQLFLTICRSLNWRSRFVTSFLPIEQELTINHPLLQEHSPLPSLSPLYCEEPHAAAVATSQVETSRICQAIQSLAMELFPTKEKRGEDELINIKAKDTKKEKKKKQQQQKRKNEGATAKLQKYFCNYLNQSQELLPNNSGNKNSNNSSSGPDACFQSWVEILCLPKNAHRESLNPQWIHVDIVHELFNQPKVVENEVWSNLLYDKLNDERDNYTTSKRKNRKRSTQQHCVSHVLAVEHREKREKSHRCQNKNTEFRITDVTPRYANKWSQTLKLRGATTAAEKSFTDLCYADHWLKETIKLMNYYSNNQTQTMKKTISNSVACEKNKSKKCPQDVLTNVNSITTTKSNIKRRRTKKMVTSSTTNKFDDNENSNDNSSSDDDGTSRQQFQEIEEMDEEQLLLKESVIEEGIPTSKAAFKNHPLYAIPSVMKMREVLATDAVKRMCGIFKGELVYKRKDISIAREQHKWLYVGRKVRDNELSNPVKLLKKVERKAKETGEFRALKTYGATSNAAVQDSCNIQDRNDGMLRLYGIWQTNVWKPNPVLPHDPIPVNQYRNIEKALINPGLVHLEYHRISIVAKKLGIPYAPCLLGFDFKAGDTKPKIKGIVVHEHNAILLREAHAEWNDHALEQEEHKRKSEIYKRWRRLVIGLRTKQRLEKEYGGGL